MKNFIRPLAVIAAFTAAVSLGSPDNAAAEIVNLHSYNAIAIGCTKDDHTVSANIPLHASRAKDREAFQSMINERLSKVWSAVIKDYDSENVERSGGWTLYHGILKEIGKMKEETGMEIDLGGRLKSNTPKPGCTLKP